MRFHRKRIDLKTLLKVDQNEKASYRQCERSKAHQNKNDDRKYHRRVCLEHAHRVQLTSNREILSFSKVLVWTVVNASKRWCGSEPVEAFSMTMKTHLCGQDLLKTRLKTRRNTFGMTVHFFLTKPSGWKQSVSL